MALSRYQWKSASLRALYSYHFSSQDAVYVNLHYGYFWNDDFPYSIHMDPGSDSIRDQIDLTALTSLGISDHWLVLFEYGCLGANYIYPYMQTALHPEVQIQLNF